MPDEQTQKNLEEAIEKFSSEMHIPAETYKSILVTSLDPTKEDLKNLDTAIQTKDFENIQLISHRLKGTYSNLRIEDISGPAARMNDLSKNAEGIEEITTLLGQLSETFKKYCELLEGS